MKTSKTKIYYELINFRLHTPCQSDVNLLSRYRIDNVSVVAKEIFAVPRYQTVDQYGSTSSRVYIFAVETARHKMRLISDKGGLHVDDKIVGLSISQWLPCPLAIWNMLFGMVILLNLVKVHIPPLPGFLDSTLALIRGLVDKDRLNFRQIV